MLFIAVLPACYFVPDLHVSTCLGHCSNCYNYLIKVDGVYIIGDPLESVEPSEPGYTHTTFMQKIVK